MNIYDKVTQFITNKKNEDFFDLVFTLFNYHAAHNVVYKKYLDFLGIKVQNIQRIEQIPFLPIQFFKNHKINTEESEAVVFKSSGTSGMQRSTHYVHNKELYRLSIKQDFEEVFGSISDWNILALLPSYQQQENSSLIFMVDYLMQETSNQKSSFYLKNPEELELQLQQNKRENKKTMLFGVSYALLDFADKYSLHYPSLVLMETGGMKGRRKEICREELHSRLKAAFGVENIYSEYAMTELLSQAYSTANGIFSPPHWMRVLPRTPENPFDVRTRGKGALNIIDLANLYSCPFIATDDLGQVFDDGKFTVSGRFDNAESRGCNLLLVE